MDDLTAPYHNARMDDHDPLNLEALERENEDRKIRVRLAQQTEEADLKWLMGSKRGRRIVWRFLDKAGTFGPSFNVDAALMAWAEGNRNQGTQWLNLILAVCPELFPTMLKEANDHHADDHAGPGR